MKEETESNGPAFQILEAMAFGMLLAFIVGLGIKFVLWLVQEGIIF